MQTTFDTIVIGAGQAGLATGYHLRQTDLRWTLLESHGDPSGSWPHYYDSLKLFSPARFSELPGYHFPGDGERYPTRDEVVGYLRAYAVHFQLPIVTGARVERIEAADGGFRVLLVDGATYQARSIVAATGAFHKPNVPHLPGQERFSGTLLHASDYCNPAPFVGQRVIVVGGGNSAVQIAVELAREAHVSLATRGPIKFRQQRILGKDIHWWWWLTQTDRWPQTLAFGYRSGILVSGAVLDTGVYQAAIAAGRPDRRAMFTSFEPDGVVWPDGTREPVDAVIFATGYQPNIDYLAGLAALDATGQPQQHYGVSLTTPGLYFIGLEDQRTYASATLRGVGPDAAYIVEHMQRYLATKPVPALAYP